MFLLVRSRQLPPLHLSRPIATLMASNANSSHRPARRHRPRRGASVATAAAPYPKPTPAQAQPVEPISTPNTRPTSPVALASNFSDVRFADFVTRGKLSAQVARGIPFEFCTHVQAATMDVILDGVDVLARAKTGTGKTIAFLVPIIEQLVSPKFRHPPLQNISALILSPTRELAQQIEKEAKAILAGCGLERRIGVQCVVGGTNVNTEVKRLFREPVDILVATPGRLIDHLENYDLASKVGNTRFLVLDEADRLLDAGFKREIARIIQTLPDRNAVPRQTLLFSATLPAEVNSIAALALLPSHRHISTVSETDTATHEHVEQRSLVVPPTETFPVLAQLLSEWLATGAKVMVFCNTARATGIAAQVFENLTPSLGVPLFTIHSRLSQAARTRATAGFTAASSAVLFTSDVTARGIDVPGVTHVVQLGLPSNVEQYIHRLGRTARAGMTGKGLLILAPYESFFLRLKGMRELSVEAWTNDMSADQKAKWGQRVAQSLDSIPAEPKEQAYQAFLGLYKGSLRDIGWDEPQLVKEAASYVRDVLRYQGAQPQGWVAEGTPAPEWLPPPIMSRTVGKMQLRGGKTLGLNIVKELPGKEGMSQGRGQGGNRGGGRGGGSGGKGGGSGSGRQGRAH